MNDRREFIKTSAAATATVWLATPEATIPLQSNGSVMAIAAHPGDALFTMGLAVAKQIENGGKGLFLSLSSGERGHSSIPVEEYGAMQRAATQKAAGMLGAEARFLDYPDAQVPYSEEASLAVCDEIRRFKPSIIITHWLGSWHKDHRNCHHVVEDARFYAGLKTLNREQPAHFAGQLYYAENWEDMDGFKADTFFDITSVVDRWAKACSSYPMWRGETGFRYSDYYESLATLRGCLSRYPKAVALMSAAGQQVKKISSF